MSFDDQEGDDQATPQKMLDDDKITSKEQADDVWTPPGLMPHDEKIPFDEEEGDDEIFFHK